MTGYQIAVILPHCQLFGGVRRFFELGEIFIRQGHQMLVFTPEGTSPEWFDFSGSVIALKEIDRYTPDLLFITEPVFLPQLLQSRARLKVFYHVGPRADLRPVLKHPGIHIFSNSTNMYRRDKKKYGIDTVKAYGGVHIPSEAKRIDEKQDPFLIMCYGRLSRKGKGTHLVVSAVKKLHRKGLPVKLLLFDSPLDDNGLVKIKNFDPGFPFEFIINHPVDDNENLFKRANVFVAVEKKGGWSNTAAEAMACGVPLIASNIGTNDFLIDGVTGLRVWRHPYFIARALKKLIGNVSLQRTLANNGREQIKKLGWEPLAAHILAFIDSKLK